MGYKATFLILTAITATSSLAAKLDDQLVGAWVSSTTVQSEGQPLEISVLSLYRSVGVFDSSTLIKLSGQCQFANLSGTWSITNNKLTAKITSSDNSIIPSGTITIDTISQLDGALLTITDEDGEQERYNRVQSKKDSREFRRVKSECIQAHILKSTPDMALLQADIKFTHKPTGISITPSTSNWLLNKSAGNKMALIRSDGAFLDITLNKEKTSDDELRKMMEKQIRDTVKAVQLKGLSISVEKPAFEILKNAPHILQASNCYTMTIDNLLPPMEMCVIHFQSTLKQGFLLGSSIIERENIDAAQSLIKSADLEAN